jgi:hypothetical protein
MANEMMGPMSGGWSDYLRSNQFQYGLLNALRAAQPQYAVGRIPEQSGMADVGIAALQGMQSGRQQDLRSAFSQRAQQTGYAGLMDDPQMIGIMSEMSPDLIVKQATALQAAKAKALADAQAAKTTFGYDLAKQANASALKNEEQTPLYKNLVAAGLKPGTPEFAEAMVRGATKPQVSIDQRAESEFNKKFGEYNAKSFFEDQKAAQDAQASLQSTIEARQLLDKGVITGFGADTLVNFGRALQQAGFNRNADPVANSQAFGATRAQEVGRIIKLFGAGTGLSDADREYATRAAAGQITMTEEAIRKILDINERASRHILDRYNSKASKIDPSMSPYPLTIDAPQAPTKPAGNSTSTGVKWKVKP